MTVAPYGYTVVKRHSGDKIKGWYYGRDYIVYPRDTPADEKHLAADLRPFTYDTQAKAIAAGRRGEYAYK